MKRKESLMVFVLIMIMVFITACGNSSPDNEGNAADDTPPDQEQSPSDEEPEEVTLGAEDKDTEEPEDEQQDTSTDPKDYNLRIYMATTDGEHLFPVTFSENTVTPATVALETLFSLPSHDYASNPVPSGIEIDSLAVQGNTASLSLKATQPINLGSWYEGLMAEAIVRTLTQFNNVDQVLLSEASGSLPIFSHIDTAVPISYSENINFENPPVTSGSTLLHLWYPDSQSMFMVPVSRAVPATQQVARASVNALLHGPATGSNLNGMFPTDVVLQDIYIEEGTCYVDFNKSFAIGDLQESMAFYTLGITLNSLPSINSVIVTVNGVIIGDTMSGFTTEEKPLVQTPATVNPIATYEALLN